MSLTIPIIVLWLSFISEQYNCCLKQGSFQIYPSYVHRCMNSAHHMNIAHDGRLVRCRAEVMNSVSAPAWCARVTYMQFLTETNRPYDMPVCFLFSLREMRRNTRKSLLLEVGLGIRVVWVTVQGYTIVACLFKKKTIFAPACYCRISALIS